MPFDLIYMNTSWYELEPVSGPLGTTFCSLNTKMTTTNKTLKKSGRESNKTEHLGKKELAASPYHRITRFTVILNSPGLWPEACQNI